MKWKCRKCWLLTLAKCDHEPPFWSGEGTGEIRPVENRVGCYKSAIQHVGIGDDVLHLCEDHASPDMNYVAHTLLGLGRYRIPTKAS